MQPAEEKLETAEDQQQQTGTCTEEQENPDLELDATKPDVKIKMEQDSESSIMELDPETIVPAKATADVPSVPISAAVDTTGELSTLTLLTSTAL